MKAEFLIQIANKVYNTNILNSGQHRLKSYGRAAVAHRLSEDHETPENISKILKKDRTVVYYYLNRHKDLIKFDPFYKELFSEFQLQVLKPLNEEMYLKEKIKEQVNNINKDLNSLNLSPSEIEAFWLDCITKAKTTS